MDYCKNSKIPYDLSINGVTSYQAACCTTDVQSMKLYDQCSWNDWPRCGSGTCVGDVVAESGTGSGGALCLNWYALKGSHPLRSYCCDQPKEDQRLDECKWYSDISPLGSDLPSDFCNANCPGGTMRVAMERNGCSGGSAKARCCRGNFKTTEKRYSNAEDILWDMQIGGKVTLALITSTRRDVMTSSNHFATQISSMTLFVYQATSMGTTAHISTGARSWTTVRLPAHHR